MIKRKLSFFQKKTNAELIQIFFDQGGFIEKNGDFMLPQKTDHRKAKKVIEIILGREDGTDFLVAVYEKFKKGDIDKFGRRKK